MLRDNEGDELMDKGKAFQSIGPRTEKLFTLDFKQDFIYTTYISMARPKTTAHYFLIYIFN